MNQNHLTVIAAVVVVLIVMVQMIVILSRYTKVGPNQLLIVSGRKRQLPDGSIVGYRVVKGGGTFVFPVLEKVDVLSLEVLTVEMLRTKARTAGGSGVEVDCTTQVKINSDDASIVPAAELFLGKSSAEIKAIARPVLEKSLVEVLNASSVESILQNPTACATTVQTASSADLSRMGLNVISVTIRNARVA
jgi:flotillin